MSYILDALKKSANERRRVQQSDPLLGQPSAYPTASRRPTRGLLPLLATLLFCLTLAFAGGWFWLILRPSPGGIPSNDVVVRDRPEATQAPSGEPGDIETAALPTSAPSQTDSPPVASTQQPGRSTVQPVQDQTAAPAEARAEVPLLANLPPALQASIPDIRFSGHVFSPVPSLRMIMADQSIVREQDLLSPELRLEEITETGVILSYRGTRFRIELLPPL